MCFAEEPYVPRSLDIVIGSGSIYSVFDTRPLMDPIMRRGKTATSEEREQSVETSLAEFKIRVSWIKQKNA